MAQTKEEGEMALRDKVKELYAKITDNLQTGGKGAGGAEFPAMEDEVQIELGRWINILSDVNAQIPASTATRANRLSGIWPAIIDYLASGPVDAEDMFERVRLAVETLLTPKPKLKLVREMRYSVKNDLLWNGGVFQRLLIRLNGGSSTMTVVWGAACTTVVGLILLAYVYPWATHTDSQFIYINQKIVLGTAIPAFLGAVVSILSRLQDFRDDQSIDPKILFMTAFFKPYIGMISGLFIISALGVGIGSLLKDIDLAPTESTTDWPSAKNFYFLYVVGFLAGFSERLTKDFIGAAEDRISPRNRTRA